MSEHGIITNPVPVVAFVLSSKKRVLHWTRKPWPNAEGIRTLCGYQIQRHMVSGDMSPENHPHADVCGTCRRIVDKPLVDRLLSLPVPPAQKDPG